MPQPLDIPYDFKNILQDFTIQYLIDRPADIVHFGVTYFNDLRQNRQSVIEKDFGQTKETSSLGQTSDDLHSKSGDAVQRIDLERLRSRSKSEFREIVKFPS
ncbi:hypothetical protein GE061_003679 [Apolygus lucorum]|uniref:Uncharacterized protein n=1 Tax=Apolygus lucorum TaxID=248454 RepID=A0A6A4JSJ1_APOLU|nr:hypothetical protein GE061_003679 [Apolygus lucorum]